MVAVNLDNVVAMPKGEMKLIHCLLYIHVASLPDLTAEQGSGGRRGGRGSD